MKKIIRYYSIETFSLWVVTQIAGGMMFENGIQTLLITGAGLTIASIFAKPIINILLLPINLVTFGLFSWLSSAVALYLVALVVPQFQIAGFFFEGFTSKWIDIPQLGFQGLFAYVAFSFILSFITSFVHWIIK